jgi:hypothetical protein
MAPFGMKINWFELPKKRAKMESLSFEEPRCKIGSKARSNSRIQFASNESTLVLRIGTLEHPRPNLKWV